MSEVAILRQPQWGLELGPVASTSSVVDNEWVMTRLKGLKVVV
jgi:hypothetical protein